MGSCPEKSDPARAWIAMGVTMLPAFACVPVPASVDLETTETSPVRISPASDRLREETGSRPGPSSLGGHEGQRGHWGRTHLEAAY